MQIRFYDINSLSTFTHREEVSVDLAAVDGPGLPAVQLVEAAVVLDEGDEVKVNLVVQRWGL